MQFLGPVFWHDLVSIARRQRVTLTRVAYGLALLAALLLLYTEKLPRVDILSGGRVRAEDLAAFGEAFFAAFLVVQFAAVILITPALAANALAEERTSNRLLFLLTTNLTNREIVAGKLFTRLLQVACLVLTGLPVLAMTQLFGGVDPNLVLSTFVALGLVGLSLACVGLACGIRAKKPQNAAWRAYQIVLAYAALSVVTIWYFELPFGRGALIIPARVNPRLAVSFVQNSIYSPPVDPEWWQSALESFNAGNPYFVYRLIECDTSRGTTFARALTVALRDFTTFHLTVAAIAGGYALLRLRAVAAAQVAGLTTTRNKFLKAVKHPPIRDRPVLWKELYCESKPRQRWLSLFFTRWFFCISFLPAWVIFLLALDAGYGTLEVYTLVFLRFGGTLVACLLCLRAATQAARSVAGEHERATLDSLLTTSLRPAEIIAGKWWGSLLSCRWILVWLIVHWCLGALTMAVEWSSVLFLTASTVVFAAFSVSIGMLCAARFRTGKQALAVTLLILIVGTTLLPWTGQIVVSPLTDAWPPTRTRAPWDMSNFAIPWSRQLAAAFSPPRALAECVIASRNYYWRGYRESGEFAQFLPYLLTSLTVYSLAALALAVLAARIFHARVRPRALVSRSSGPLSARVVTATG